MKKAIITKNASETQAVAQALTRAILSKPKSHQGAVVIGLVGELGGGKTTFVQGLAKAFGVKDKILSPTFVILKKFKIPLAKKTSSRLLKGPDRLIFKNFYHIDCYRLHNFQELMSLGFSDLLLSSQNIIVIEWAEKIKKILPQDTIWLKFSFIDQNTRKIILQAGQLDIPVK